MVFVGIDEGRYQDSGGAQALHGRREAGALGARVEPTLGRDLLTVLRDEADLVGVDLACERDLLLGERALEIQERLHCRAQDADVALLDVAAILAEMNRDPLGAGELARRGGRDRIGLRSATRLSHRGDVVNVDVQSRHLGLKPWILEAGS